MITSKVNTANKNLWIYRPDITLPDICRLKGPSIVRKMIPCFSFPEIIIMQDRLDENGNIIEKSNNSFKAPEDPKFSFVYGVNVRTPRVNDILPFSTSYIYDKNIDEGKLDQIKINKGDIEYTVPAFTDEFKIRELLLSATINNKGIITEKNIVILSLISEKQVNVRKLKKALLHDKGFFLVQIKALKLQKRAFLWLTSEDYNVNKAGDALSNIIAISDDYDAVVQHIMPHRIEFINLLFLIKARYLFDTEIAQRKTAIASAKAAIMARNMSHNLGSHVMAYLKQHLNSVQDMLRDNVLASLFDSQDDLSSIKGLKIWYNKYLAFLKEQKTEAEKEDTTLTIKDQTEQLSEVALPFLVGLGKFISYLQERQDFIATIATDYVPYFSTVNFKDFIYDELNPDLRYERHKDRIGLQPDNILLGNIARSEGLARSTNPTKGKQMADIVIKYKTFDGKPVTLLPDNDSKKTDLEEMRSFMVYLPGGVVGRQAFFSIIENIIRNAAKHGNWANNSNNNLELTINKYTIEDIKNGIKTDYVPKGDLQFDRFINRYYSASSDIDDLFIITITDNTSFEAAGTPLKKCKNLLSIRKALIEPYIDNASVDMLQTNKGIKEMRISAAWMRGIIDDAKINPLYISNTFDPRKSDPEDHWIIVKPFEPKRPKKGASEEEILQYKQAVENYRKECEVFDYKYWKNDQWINQAPVIMVRACANKRKEDYHLQYVFCLPRPKDLAIILSDDNPIFSLSNYKNIKQWFSQNSWNIYSVNDFKKAKNKSYEFILLNSDLKNDEINNIKLISPHRIFCQEQITNIITINDCISTKFKNFNSVKIDLYKKLCDFAPESDTIVISDQKTSQRKDLEDCKPQNVIINDGQYKGKYLYRTHNETELLFTDYLKNADENTCFVEGITGDNSTDRLVRNDIINELWLYKHLHAMKTTAGVFDERIFSKVFKKDESDIKLSQLPFEELKKQLSGKVSDNLKLRIRSAKTETALNKILGKDARALLGDYMAIAFQKKGIGVFNLIKTKEGLDIYGYNGIAWDDANKHVYSKIAKIGSITQTNGTIEISNYNNLSFDYLSIHQGLLDKVYEQFGIRNNALAKHDFTKAFYKSFCTNSDLIEYEDKNIVDKDGKPQKVNYLPNLMIHSGRSKPSFADMPQHQPFIQYAAIEHAILDCKYSLIDLLDFARYE